MKEGNEKRNWIPRRINLVLARRDQFKAFDRWKEMIWQINAQSNSWQSTHEDYLNMRCNFWLQELWTLNNNILILIIESYTSIIAPPSLVDIGRLILRWAEAVGQNERRDTWAFPLITAVAKLKNCSLQMASKSIETGEASAHATVVRTKSPSRTLPPSLTTISIW